MVIDFSTIGTVKEQPTLVLRNADGTAIQTLGYAYGLKASICYNEMSSITFDIPAYVEGVKTPHYDDVIGMRIVDVIGWGRFILMNPSVTNDGVREIKSCKAYSLEYELTYKKVFLEESTYNFWNPVSPDDTVLGIILSDLSSWTIGTVDEDLIGKYRTLSSEDANVYNFIKSDLQTKYGCIFDFDTYTRTINVRSTANEAVSKPVYLSMDNLVKEIQIDEDSENIFTVLDVNGGEDVDIRTVNPLGSNKIYNLDYFMNTTHFEQSLIDKWNSWKKSFEANQLTYYNTSIERMLKTSAILTEQVVLSNLENITLAALNNERAVYVEYLAQLTKKSSDYNEFQNKLDDVNERIADAREEMSVQKEVISALEDEANELANRLLEIQKSVSFDNFFTRDELVILDRYFKEDAIEESSFVVSEVESYSDSDISNSLSNVTVSFARCKFSKVVTDGGKTMYTIDDGILSLSSSAVTLSANVVSACFEKNDDGSIVLSAFLNKGAVGNASFPSGCISITGKASTVTTSGSSGLSFTITKGTMYFTRNTTDYERYSVSWDLFEYGKETLDALAYPSYTFDVSSANFMSIEEFAGFVKQLELGQKIYLNTDESVLEPIFIGIDIDFENLASLTLQFSDKYSSSNNSFKLVELLDQSISMGKTVESNKLSYSSFVNSGASTKVKEFMDSALDVAKNAILSSSGQGVSWDDTGLHLRKYIDSDNPGTGYEDEQIWMINNSIVFTDDGWQTAKMAIGKIIDENIARYPETSDTVFDAAKIYYYVDDNDEYQIWEGTEKDWADRPLLYEKDITSYGIVAPYIVGTILAGQNLVIDTEDGSFRVDSSGVHIDSMKFYITHDDSSYDTTLGDELRELVNADNKTAQGLSDAIAKINDIDKKVENTVTTLYQDTIPNSAREGDLWYVTGNCYNEGKTEIIFPQGRLYRYNGETWDEITDADAIEAIEKANNAQATADGKIVTYYQKHVPYLPTVGDLWYNISESKKVTRNVEVGDDLSGVTLYFDTGVTVDDLLKTNLVFRSESGEVYADYNYLFELMSETNNNPKYDGTYLVLKIGALRPTFIYESGVWNLEALTIPTTFGTVVEVEKRNPFYNAITATFSSNYEPKKWYRYNGTSWVLIEDGDIEKVKIDISNIGKTLGEYITEEGYLTASKLKGAISTTLSTMKNGAGNVLFDDDGIWLLNAATKEASSSAIWMNERGILFGTGSVGYIDTEDGEDNAWTWTTAIGHDGIIADAMATKTLSAFTIDGGSINIGNGNFTVDSNGNLVAKSGTFSGTLKATTLRGNIEADADSDSWLLGCGISIGNNPTKNSGNFYVDTDGNVTMKGNINMSDGKITWSSNNTPVQVRYSIDGVNWHITLADTDYYAQYSYDGGNTWTGTVQIRGEKGDKGDKGDTGARGAKGKDGADGSDANVTFQNVNNALGTLFKTWEGGTSTTITNTYIYSPQIKGGEFYGSTFYAGDGNGYSQMDAAGFTLYDYGGVKKAGIGCYDGDWTYPYLILGAGAGVVSNGSGLIYKFGCGIWIGESSVLQSGGRYPGGTYYAEDISSDYPNATGVFIDFYGDTIYRYSCGVPTELGSGVAKFG